MMGSSLLAMPWGLEGCGWILGLFFFGDLYFFCAFPN